MSGNKDLQKRSDYEDLTNNLDDYINNKSIEVTDINYEVKDILNLTESGLRNLTEQECLEKAFCLTGYCDYIHILYTKENIKLEWCSNLISKMVSQYDYPKYTKWEQKIPILAQSNDLARKTLEAQSVAGSREKMLKEKLGFMQDQIDILKKLAYTKRSRR